MSNCLPLESRSHRNNFKISHATFQEKTFRCDFFTQKKQSGPFTSTWEEAIDHDTDLRLLDEGLEVETIGLPLKIRIILRHRN